MGDGMDRLGGKLQLHVIQLKQLLILLGNGVFRLCQDLHQGVLVQKIQGYHHRHTAHKFRDQAEFGQILGHGLL